MLMIDHRDSSWWYWLATVLFLTAGVAGWPEGFLLAIGLTVIQIVHYGLQHGSLGAFPLQVRIGYLLLLLIALPEGLQWLFWVPTIGTWAQVLFGYCTMARFVSLMPWNRTEALSLGLLRRTFLSAPVRGSILRTAPRGEG
ncbi:MAG: hypothetical protein ACOZAP_04425 [Pseudomonadota bacterium]|jgi:hypothetical protein